jgi:NADH:ubiquinone oxidoreductase subunit 6 (subunit J)
MPCVPISVFKLHPQLAQAIAPTAGNTKTIATAIFFNFIFFFSRNSTTTLCQLHS